MIATTHFHNSTWNIVTCSNNTYLIDLKWYFLCSTITSLVTEEVVQVLYPNLNYGLNLEVRPPAEPGRDSLDHNNSHWGHLDGQGVSHPILQTYFHVPFLNMGWTLQEEPKMLKDLEKQSL